MQNRSCAKRDSSLHSASTPVSTSPVVSTESTASTAREPSCFAVTSLREQPAVDRDERSREHSFAQQVLQEVRDAHGGTEDITGERGPKVIGEDLFADESGDPAQEDSERDQAGAASCRFFFLGPLHGTMMRPVVTGLKEKLTHESRRRGRR